MKQIVHDVRRGRVAVHDVPVPAVAAGQILIAVRHSLVSAGTERTVVQFAESSLLGKARRRPDLAAQAIDKVKREGLLPAWRAVSSRLDQPLALGYAVAGTVLAIGADVDGIAVGDAVAAAGAGHAVHAEVVSVPKNLVVRLPATVDAEAGAFTTLGAIALQGVRVAGLRLGETAAVLGLGLLGQLTAQILRAAGCRVLAFDPREERVRLARGEGADAAAHAEAFETLCRTATDGHGVDAVLLTADASDNGPITMAARICRDKGVVVAVGAVGMTVPRKPFYEKELELRLSRSYGPGRYDRAYEEEGRDYPYGFVRWTERRNMEAFVRLLADGAVTVRHLITHRFGVDDAERAYAVLAGRTSEAPLGIVVTYPSRDTDVHARRVNLRPRPAAIAVTRARLGVVGAGAFATGVLLPALRRAGAGLAGVCARSGVSARHAASRFGFEYCTTEIDELLADATIDAVVIASPHHLHAAQVIAALEAGKHVFVEKPLCLDDAELARIEAAHARAGRILMVGFNRRFAPMSARLKAFARDGGEPLFVQYRVNAGWVPPDHWVQDPHTGGGRLIGEAVHFIDLAGWLVGAAPQAVTASGLPDSGRYRADNLTVRLQYPDGSLAEIAYLANGSRALGKERIEVHGGGRSAVLDDFRTLQLMGRGTTRARSWLQADKGHDAECRAFVEALRGAGPSPIAFVEAAATMRAAFTARADLLRAAPRTGGA
jgi:predicted dehydrogenase/NADPH:quinone reductase-like Zn-dependent oxidoreductase